MTNKCEMCGKEVTDKVKDFSMKKYHKILCYGCQQKAKTITPKQTTTTTKKLSTPELLALMKITATVYSKISQGEPQYKEILKTMIKIYKELKED